MKRLTLQINGLVQGVGFRWFVMSAASRVGLGGYVRNCPDGSVEVVAEGADEALEDLENACRKGPRFARVDQVNRQAEPLHSRSFTSFEIR